MTIQAPPLWSVAELETVTGGEWLCPPGAAWAPQRVRTTAAGDIRPEWLGDGIVLFASEDRLQKWFASADGFDLEPAGCIVVGRRDAESPYLPRDRAILVVDRITGAMRALARRARDRLEGRVVLVSGALGDDIVRALLVHILQRHGTTVTNSGAGVFRAHAYQEMASAQPGTPFVVLELGAGGPRDSFRDVSAVLRPHVVVLADLDTAGLGARASTEGRADAIDQALQLAEHMVDDGTLVLSPDVTTYDDLMRLLQEERRFVPCGLDAGAAYRLLGIRRRGSTYRVEARADGVAIEYDLPVPWRSVAVKSLAALAASSALTFDRSANAASLSQFTGVRGPQDLTLTVRGAEITLIDERSEATPGTVRSALGALQDLEPGPAGRRIAVLGDIRRPEPAAPEVYAELARVAQHRRVDRVYTFGSAASHILEALPAAMAAGHFDELDTLVEALGSDLRTGDVVTLNLSRAARPDRVVRLLQEQSRLAPTQPPVASISLVSAAAAARLGEGVPAFHRTGQLPVGSWLYSADQAGASLVAGDGVEELADGGIVEGAWDRPFEERRPERAIHLFGSGLTVDDDRLVILTPKHTLEGVFVLEHKPSRRVFISNSLAFACAAADVTITRGVTQPSILVGKGFYKFDTCLIDTEELSLHKLVYYNYAVRPDGSAVRLPLPEARQFRSYAEYREGLSAVVGTVVTNAGHPERRRAYRPLTTVSAGYDSAACAALAREAGAREAVTIRTARRGLVDSGRPVAEALGLSVLERERLDLPATGERTELVDEAHREVAAEFLATGMGGDDLFFLPFEDVLAGTVLFTGFHGDKVWDKWFAPSTDAKRGDISGSSLGEYRARLGFLNLPVPFIFIRSQPSVRAVSRSREMGPWSVGGPYDRPIPRRIAEEAGVPRAAFGQRKMAGAHLIIDRRQSPFAAALRTMTARYAHALDDLGVANSAG